MLTIKNNGPDIIETNYFESELARRGAFFLSINAGAFRLLVPPGQETVLDDFCAVKEIIVSRGPWVAMGRNEAIEILFDDHSKSPYSIQMGATEQVDRLPAKEDAGRWYDFSVWIRWMQGPECIFRSICYFRLAPGIPYLEPIKS